MRRQILIILAVMYILFLCGCTKKNDGNTVPEGIKISEFNNTPVKCAEAQFYLERMTKEKLSHKYRLKVSFWDSSFSPTRHQDTHASDVVFSAGAGDGEKKITILTDHLPTEEYLRPGFGK
jgi:hypothetical protein